MSSSRRHFFMQIAGAGTLLASSRAFAQAAGPKVDEADPTASSLGYKQDTTKVDLKKYPKHEATQRCGNCALFQGKATDATGPCPLFPGKQVAANGWCMSWTKKA